LVKGLSARLRLQTHGRRPDKRAGNGANHGTTKPSHHRRCRRRGRCPRSESDDRFGACVERCDRAADISQSFEEHLETFVHFYAEDIDGTTDTMKEPVQSKAAVCTRLAGFLVPLHVFAEIGGMSVSIQSSPIRGAAPSSAPGVRQQAKLPSY